MAYTWTDGELITAEKLNETGGGVLIVNANEENDVATLDKTYKEIKASFENGQNVILKSIGNNVSYLGTVKTISERHGSDNTEYVIEGATGVFYTTNSEDGYPATGGLS